MRGRRMPEAVRRRVSAGLRRRQAQGLPIGQPRKNPIRHFRCLNCGKVSEDRKAQTERTACSNLCATRLANKAHRKLPPDEEVARLYLSGLTIIEIAERYKSSYAAVGRSLKKLEVKGRTTGTRARPRCRAKGCERAVYRSWDETLKVWQGTHCKEHGEHGDAN